MLFIAGSISYAHQNQEEPSYSPADWREGYTLILMSNTDAPSANQTRDFVVSGGGKISIISPPHVMLGWVSMDLVQDLIGKYGIELITQQPIDLGSIKYRDEQSLAAASFFNSVVSRTLAEPMAFSRELEGEPLINDVRERPPLDYEHYEKNLAGTGIFPSPGYSDSMTGTVGVCLFFVESDGSIDQDKYTWHDLILGDTAQQDMINQVFSGLSWWANRAPVEAHLSFSVYGYVSTHPVTQQGYEPILHPSTDDYLWINKIMENLGHASGSVFERVEAFNAWFKGFVGTDRAYSAFFGHNPWWLFAPSKFTDGYFAYAYRGGPYLQMLSQNDGHPAWNNYRVFAHETGHIFQACDEYYQEGYGGCTSCGSCGDPRGTLNGNCEYCNPNAVSCMMRDNSDGLCSYTRSQIGWAPINVSFNSDPTGRRISIDGGVSTQTSFSVSWMPGISHLIEAPSPQTEGTTRYVFRSWSDGGAQAHSVAPQSSSNYWAYFDTQFLLTTSSNPLGWGTVSPSGNNWYDMWQPVTLTASEALEYIFTHWSGDLNSTQNPVTVWMDKPKTITANFILRQPDLVEISVSNPPAIILLGKSFSVTDSARNQGTLESGASVTRYYLSLDGLKDGSDILLEGTRFVPGLRIGENSTENVNVTVPPGSELGVYYLLACSDDTSIIEESNEGNNCIASSTKVEVITVDLTETYVGNPPETSLAGAGFTIIDSTMNQGNKEAGASTTFYYFSQDMTKDSGDVLLVGSRLVPALGPGFSSVGSADLIIPGDTPGGVYYLLACADGPDTVNENEEGNNCLASGLPTKLNEYDLNFLDIRGYARLCVNSVTGSWAYTLLSGFGAGNTFTGRGEFFRKGNILWMDTMDTEKWGLNMIYNMHLKKAMAAFGNKESGIRSSLIDTDTADNTPDCD
jgi:hypothetical protein